jgi:hypothetical protein
MRVLDALPRIAELSLEAARQAGSLAVSVARTLAEPVLGRRSDDANGWTRNWEPPSSRPVGEPPPPPATPRRPPATTPAATPARPPRAAAGPRPVPVAEPEPEHVDRDAVVVAEFADAGAEDGAGAQVRVDEPWDGYSQMKAKDVTAQLATADPAMLAVVRLYETSNRNRRTVLAEIDRRLATTGS